MTAKPTQNQPDATWKPGRPYTVLRWAIGLLLVAAAVLKGYQLGVEPVANEGWLTYRWSLTAQVMLELLGGLWLLGGLAPRLTWAATLACFVGFSGVTLYKGVTGEASCGCFGLVEVSPWYTLALDVALVGALLAARPQPRGRPGRRRVGVRAATVGALWLLLGAPLLAFISAYEPATLAAGGKIIGADRFVVLRPSEWVGKRLPLLEHIDVGDTLARGYWLVVLVHDHCRDCREAVGRYRTLAEESQRDPSAARVALIELTGAAPPADSPLAGLPVTHGRMDPQREWFCRTPRELLLRDGKVLSVDTQAELPPAVGAAAGTPDVLTYEFGSSALGGTAKHTFVLSNTTEQTWSAPELFSDCACASTPKAPKSIEPGESWEIPVEVILDAASDRFVATTLITFANRRPFRLVVAGRVVLQAPAHVDFGRFKKDQAPTKTFHVRSVTTDPIHVKAVRYDKDVLTVSYARDPAGVNDLRFEVGLVDGLTGRVQTKLQIDTDDPEHPTFTVRVSGHVLGPVVARPSVDARSTPVYSQPDNGPDQETRMTFYDAIADDYDDITGAAGRAKAATVLAAEIRRRYDVGSVLDAACGTGLHAFAFAAAGVRTTGADISEAMLDQARAKDDGSDVRWLCSPMQTLASRLDDRYDAVLCVGNSLAHLLNDGDLDATIAGFAQLTTDRGVVILHVLNYARILAKRERIIGVNRHGDRQYVRFYDFLPDRVQFNILEMVWDGDTCRHRLNSTLHRPYGAGELHEALSRQGLAEIAAYGDMQFSPFEADSSPALVLVARRGGA